MFLPYALMSFLWIYISIAWFQPVSLDDERFVELALVEHKFRQYWKIGNCCFQLVLTCLRFPIASKSPSDFIGNSLETKSAAKPMYAIAFEEAFMELLLSRSIQGGRECKSDINLWALTHHQCCHGWMNKCQGIWDVWQTEGNGTLTFAPLPFPTIDFLFHIKQSKVQWMEKKRGITLFPSIFHIPTQKSCILEHCMVVRDILLL